MSEEYYRKITTGWLQPVLDGTKQVFDAGKHVEVSNLMITDLSDNEDVARSIADWVLSSLNEYVPLHFVRFHPDYKMTDTIRTPVERLVRAREVAREMGVRHVYLGNVYDTPHSNTFCNKCNTLLVDRYGLNAVAPDLTKDGNCAKCGEHAHIKLPFKTSTRDSNRYELPDSGYEVKSFNWHGDIRSVHVLVQNTANEPRNIYHCRLFDGETSKKIWHKVELKPQESFRFIIAKGHRDERGCSVAIGEEINSNLHEVFDRAHFPTVSVDEGAAETDITPLPSLSKIAGK
jgi:pyruvate formate lyase activating enzyme